MRQRLIVDVGRMVSGVHTDTGLGCWALGLLRPLLPIVLRSRSYTSRYSESLIRNIVPLYTHSFPISSPLTLYIQIWMRCRTHSRSVRQRAIGTQSCYRTCVLSHDADDGHHSSLGLTPAGDRFRSVTQVLGVRPLESKSILVVKQEELSNEAVHEPNPDYS